MMNIIVKRLLKHTVVDCVCANQPCFVDLQYLQQIRYRPHKTWREHISIQNFFLSNNIGISKLSQVHTRSLKTYIGISSNKFPSSSQIPSTLNLESCPIQHRRNKSTKKWQQKRSEYYSDSDSESDIEETLPQGTKLSRVRVQSLRLDGFLKKALNVARNKVEAAFYEGNIRINGEKPNKKSIQLRIGDEVDLIRGPSPKNPEYLTVSRVEIVSVEEGGSDDEDEVFVKLRLSKTLYIENYQIHPWKRASSSE